MNDETIAKMQQDISDIRSDIRELQTVTKSALKRIDEQTALTASVNKLALSIERMSMEIKTMRSDIDEIKNKSKKRWETVVTEAIKLIVAAVIGAFLYKVGLK